MFKHLHHSIAFVLLLFCSTPALAQVAMPDTVCVGTSRLYHVNDPNTPSTYTWKIDGIIQPSTINEIAVTWNTPGVFQLSVQEHGTGGCDGDIRSGLVYVKMPPKANAGLDTTLCFGNNIYLNGSGGGTYQWTPSIHLSNAGIANPLFFATTPGLFYYTLNVQYSNGCAAAQADTVAIRVLPKAIVFAGNDTTIAISQPLQLHAIDVNGTGFSTYLWSPGNGLNNNTIKDPIATFNNLNNVTYTLIAKSPQGCTAQDEINIKIFLAPDIFVPSGFTPNGDNLNDLLRPTLIGIRDLRYFTIYNRYGQQVYTTSTPKAGWDGRINGVMQNTGNYVWIAEAVDYNGNILTRKGYALLIK